MPTALFLHYGDHIDHTPSGDIAAGDVVVMGDLIGIANAPIAANTERAVAVSGVFQVPKATGTSTAIAKGKKVYWDATAKQATETATGNTFMGKTILAAADSDATVRVRLSQ
jgi:predicted RecA/RadA family phage recombinase